jgi:hypothetical protein
MRNDELKNLRDEIRSWTDRPPERTPKQARTRVLARIGGPRRRSRWGLAVATAALVAGLALGLLFLQPTPPAGPPVATVEPAPPPASPPASKLLLYELRSGTKLYLDLGPATPPDTAPPPPT